MFTALFTEKQFFVVFLGGIKPALIHLLNYLHHLSVIPEYFCKRSKTNYFKYYIAFAEKQERKYTLDMSFYISRKDSRGSLWAERNDSLSVVILCIHHQINMNWVHYFKFVLYIHVSHIF